MDDTIVSLNNYFFQMPPPPLLHTITSHGDPLIIAHLLECDRIHFEIDRTSHGFICHNNMNKLGKKTSVWCLAFVEVHNYAITIVLLIV